jgi:hypothetical protein
MFLFTPIQIEQLKATHDYLKTDGKPIHFIEADGKPIHCIAADRVAYFRQLVDAVHEILKYYNFPNNPKMSGFYAALLETNNNNVDLALHCMCVFLVVNQLINDNFLHVWEIINLHHKLYGAIESFDDFYREVKHQQNLLPAPVLDPSYLKSLLPRDEYSNNKVLDKFISHSFSFRDMFASWGKVKGNIHIVLDIFHKRLQLSITDIYAHGHGNPCSIF